MDEKVTISFNDLLLNLEVFVQAFADVHDDMSIGDFKAWITDVLKEAEQSAITE